MNVYKSLCYCLLSSRLRKCERPLTSLRGGVFFIKSFKFQVQSYAENNGKYRIVLVVNSLIFRGSEGSAAFGNPCDIHSHSKVIEKLDLMYVLLE